MVNSYGWDKGILDLPRATRKAEFKQKGGTLLTAACVWHVATGTNYANTQKRIALTALA